MTVRLIIQPLVGDPCAFGNYASIEDAYMVATRIKGMQFQGSIYIDQEPSLMECALNPVSSVPKRIIV